MKNLIAADLGRIFRKPTYRIALALCFVLSLIWAVRARLDVWNGFSFAAGQAGALNMCGYILGISIYLSVYADEFSSNSMQCLIGHGVSRFRLLLAKFTDCVIVTAVSYLLYYLFTIVLGLVMGAGMNMNEFNFISGIIMVAALKSLGYATFSMIILYWTKNVGLATFTDVFLLFFGGMFMGLLNEVPVIKLYHPERFLFEGMLTRANVSLQLGQVDAWFWVFFAIVRICVFSIIVSFLLFRKRELDF